MNNQSVDSESKVSGNHAHIPADVRRELDIDDGDMLRWHIEENGTLRVDVVSLGPSTFSAFDGFDGERETDVTTNHDAWAIEIE